MSKNSLHVAQADLNNWIYLLRKNISAWPVTVGSCTSCHKEMARGGGTCKTCVLSVLEKMVGDSNLPQDYYDMQCQIVDLEYIRDIQREYPDVNNPEHIASRERAGVLTTENPSAQIQEVRRRRDDIHRSMMEALLKKHTQKGK